MTPVPAHRGVVGPRVARCPGVAGIHHDGLRAGLRNGGRRVLGSVDAVVAVLVLVMREVREAGERHRPARLQRTDLGLHGSQLRAGGRPSHGGVAGAALPAGVAELGEQHVDRPHRPPDVRQGPAVHGAVVDVHDLEPGAVVEDPGVVQRNLAADHFEAVHQRDPLHGPQLPGLEPDPGAEVDHLAVLGPLEQDGGAAADRLGHAAQHRGREVVRMLVRHPDVVDLGEPLRIEAAVAQQAPTVVERRPEQPGIADDPAPGEPEHERGVIDELDSGPAALHLDRPSDRSAATSCQPPDPSQPPARMVPCGRRVSGR